MERFVIEMEPEPIRAAVYTLAPPGGLPPIRIAVDSEEQDEITTAIREGRYEVPAHYALLLDRIRPGSRVLDLGTHIGTFALLAASRGAEVLGIEASPRNGALLRASAALNGFERLHVASYAAGDHEGELEFIQAGPYGLVATPVIDSPRIRVPLRRVDEIVREHGWERVELIKMDIEGSEPAALRGMSALLSTTPLPVLLYESNGHTLHLAGSSPDEVSRALAQRGYQLYLADNGTLRPHNDALPFQGLCNVDYLALPGALGDLPTGWRRGPALTNESNLAILLATAESPHRSERSYAARLLQRLPPDQQESPPVRRTLRRLMNDEHALVRQDMAWWQPPADESVELRAALAERDEEIARLRALVEGYERGRMMRLLRAVQRLVHRPS